MKIPKLLFKGFIDFESIYIPSPTHPCWTGFFPEAISAVGNNPDSGIVLFYLSDVSKIKILDICNDNHTQIFGNFFKHYIYVFPPYISIYGMMRHIIDEYIINNVNPIDVNDLINSLEKNAYNKFSCDDISKTILSQIVDKCNQYKNQNEKQFIDRKIFPIFANIAKQNGYNIISEYEYDIEEPSFAFISNDGFPINQKCITIIRNKDFNNKITNETSPIYKFLNSLDIYNLNFDFISICQHIQKLKTN